jgi:hypothetical protein
MSAPGWSFFFASAPTKDGQSAEKAQYFICRAVGRDGRARAAPQRWYARLSAFHRGGGFSAAVSDRTAGATPRLPAARLGFRPVGSRDLPRLRFAPLQRGIATTPLRNVSGDALNERGWRFIYCKYVQ